MAFHGSRLVFFMVPGWFSWVFMVPGWFFTVPGGLSWFLREGVKKKTDPTYPPRTFGTKP